MNSFRDSGVGWLDYVIFLKGEVVEHVAKNREQSYEVLLHGVFFEELPDYLAAIVSRGPFITNLLMWVVGLVAAGVMGYFIAIFTRN